jgi:hypothetical protein
VTPESSFPDKATVFVPITPCRVVDTRQAGGPLTNREIREWAISGTGTAFANQGGQAGGCNIPDAAAAVEASVTAVSPTTSGFFRAYPANASMPNATFMNYAARQDITNTGAITITQAARDLKGRNFGGTTHYVIDIQGYFIDPALVAPDKATVFVPITPCRVVDTRQAGGPLTNREIREWAISGTGTAFANQGGQAGGCGIPDAAAAVEASVTAVSPTTSGFFRAYPANAPMPNATFMNYAARQDITNTGAITITQAARDLKGRNFGGTTHYVIDIQGYFIDPALVAPDKATVFVPITPCRVVDTRQAGGPLTNREIREWAISGTGTAFANQGGQAGGCGIPDAAAAVEASVTAVSPTTSGFFRAYPANASMPNATFMNYAARQDITNTGAITITQAARDLKGRNFGGTTHYVIDIQGYFIGTG